MSPTEKPTEVKTSLLLKEHCFKWKINNWNVSSLRASLESESFAIPGVKASLKMKLFMYLSGNFDLMIDYDDTPCLKKCGIETYILINNQKIESTLRPFKDMLYSGVSNGKVKAYYSPPNLLTSDELVILCNMKYVLSSFEVSGSYNDKMIVNNFGKLFSDKKFCDVVLLAGNEKLSAHIAVLAAVSPYFFAMFDNQSTIENQMRVVNFTNDKDITADNLRGFLEYIYGGKSISELSSMVSDLFILADKFRVEQLRETCECYMSENITEENIVDILLFSDKCHCEVLKKKALSFAKMYINVVKASDKFNELIKIEDVIRNLL